MQSINIKAINPLFMFAIFGTAAGCLLIAIASFLNWHQLHTAFLLAGSLLYLIGAVGVTIVFNVPLNNALAIVKPESTEGANLWARYLMDWTFWNHIRTIAALIASTLFAAS